MLFNALKNWIRQYSSDKLNHLTNWTVIYQNCNKFNYLNKYYKQTSWFNSWDILLFETAYYSDFDTSFTIKNVCFL